MQFEGFSYFSPHFDDRSLRRRRRSRLGPAKEGFINGSGCGGRHSRDVYYHTSPIAVSIFHRSATSFWTKPTGCWTWVFSIDIMQIVKQMPTKRQTILFSATLPPKIRQLAKQILKDPAEINIAISKPNEAIYQSLISVMRRRKWLSSRSYSVNPTVKKPLSSLLPSRR